MYDEGKYYQFSKTLSDYDLKGIAELHIFNILKSICKTLKIPIEEWTVDKNLLIAILKNIDSADNECMTKCMLYDNSYRLAKSLKIKIDPKYRWFLNIKEHIKQNN